MDTSRRLTSKQVWHYASEFIRAGSDSRQDNIRVEWLHEGLIRDYAEPHKGDYFICSRFGLAGISFELVFTRKGLPLAKKLADHYGDPRKTARNDCMQVVKLEAVYPSCV